jgi:NAD dependent epimerase/dehydratase
MDKLKGKRVFVTGADGFIGSHLVELLAQRGAHVRALSLYNSFNSHGWLEELGSTAGVEIVSGDIRDQQLIAKLVEGSDVLFHLASLIAIPYSYHAPESYVQTNVQGTLNVMQAARANGVMRVIHVSTSEVYGTAQRVPIDEYHPLQPQSPYSASKIAADAMAISFFHAFRLGVTVARPFNTFGPRQSARAVIPTILAQVLSGKPSIRLGRLDPTRDFNYVTDTCRGLLAIAECDSVAGQTLNIGSGTEISVGDLAKLIAELVDRPFEIESDDARLRPGTSEVERLLCDSSRLRALTGWKPEVALREGLVRTVEWFRKPANLSRYKPDVYNV